MRQDIWIGDVNILCRLYVPHMGVPFIHQEPPARSLTELCGGVGSRKPLQDPLPSLSSHGPDQRTLQGSEGEELGDHEKLVPRVFQGLVTGHPLPTWSGWD